MSQQRSYTLEYKLDIIRKTKTDFNYTVSATARATDIDRKRNFEVGILFQTVNNYTNS